MEIDLPGIVEGDNVISIEVARKHRFERTCQHYRIYIDPDFAEIECRDCERKLNPVEWLAFMVGEWARVERLFKMYRDAKTLYDEKEKAQCQHCKRMTRINPPNDFAKHMRERGHMV